MGLSLFEWLERRFKSQYIRILESECERLRSENRQLMNSILKSHNMEGIADKPAKESKPINRPNWFNYARKMEREAIAAKPEVKQNAAG